MLSRSCFVGVERNELLCDDGAEFVGGLCCVAVD
jgi:hypothetical protein